MNIKNMQKEDGSGRQRRLRRGLGRGRFHAEFVVKQKSRGSISVERSGEDEERK